MLAGVSSGTLLWRSASGTYHRIPGLGRPPEPVGIDGRSWPMVRSGRQVSYSIRLSTW